MAELFRKVWIHGHRAWIHDIDNLLNAITKRWIHSGTTRTISLFCGLGWAEGENRRRAAAQAPFAARFGRGSCAPYGLGAEVRRALNDRRPALRQLGMPEDPSRRLASLRELERRSVGQELAASSGRAFVPTVPDGMHGTVQLHLARAGNYYAIVSDATRFAVIPATAAHRDLDGKRVTISRDPGGRTVLRATPERDLGR